MANLNKINVLVTGAGAPGISGTIYSLKNNPEKRKINIIGTDIKDNVIGKYLCNKFFTVPKPSDEKFIEEMLKICKKEKIQVLIPQTTDELPKLSQNKEEFGKIGTRITISDYESIRICNNKFELTKLCKELKIPYPEFYIVTRFDDLMEKAKKLGFPEKPVVIKPPESSGMRGLRIIDEKINMKQFFYDSKPSGVITDTNIPTSLYITSQELYRIIGEEFPELMIMEFLPGKEYTVDCFRTEKESIIIPRTRDVIRTGITFDGTTEKNEDIINACKKISEKLNLKYMYGFQFKKDNYGTPKILESNPRVQGTMVASTLAGANIIYASVKYALGEKIPKIKINWNSRIIRYWGAVGIENNKLKKIMHP
ncbi:MAG: ATP-grasp domain-containing protein [Candidatus Woesearchaeota archaeon]